ncbi:MAG: S8 family serine peptidase [Acidobacteriota bacterium]
MRRILFAVGAALLAGLLVAASDMRLAPKEWEFLSTTDIGARAFIDAHPQWDGRGVLIAVCDSGVDLDLPGLQTTSDGKPKILDARVFSDEGRIHLEEAELTKDAHGEAYHGKEGKWLYGADRLPVKPAKGEKVLVGYFKEEAFQNSEAEGGDLNGNGRADDVYGLIAFKEGQRWVAYLDTNGDESLADEQPIGDFSETRRFFHLRGNDPHGQARVMTFALNLWPDEKEAALYMADGAHGTHVAGICAGFGIDGQPGYDGIAPGAQILALKIGNNTLSGGATTPGSMVSAWRYAVKRAGELGMPLVIQMSYGVGSEVEGKAVAEKLIDELLDENPGVVACVSAGNEGPGISTVGMPAGARDVLSVVAVMNRSTAKDLLGVDLSQDEIFSFSDRGAELAKPDVAAPGFSASTVPNYEEGRNVMRGTSMASPQASGACALLLSAMKAEGMPVSRDLVYAAVERGAAPLPGYGPVDQGWGLINVARAWSVLQALAKRNPALPLQFRAETESPELAGGKGGAVFWRGSFYPADHPQIVTVRPILPKDLSADERAGFYEAFDLESTAPWVRTDKGAAYMKAEAPASVPISFDAAHLKKPGLYQARILGYARGAGDRSSVGPDWAVPVTVVVPEPLEPHNDYTLERRVAGLRPAKVERLFFRADPTLAGLHCDVKLDGPRGTAAAAYLFDPQGREITSGYLREGRTELESSVEPEDWQPGVWELDLVAAYTNRTGADLKVAVRGFPLARPAAESVVLHAAQGKTPSGELSLVSALPFTFRGEASGRIEGSVTRKPVRLHSATWSRKVTLAPGEKQVDFRLAMSPRDFGLFTDVSVLLLDGEGKAVASTGMTYRWADLSYAPSKPGAEYTLKVTAATADPEAHDPSWTLDVEEVHLYAQPIGLSLEPNEGGRVVLYPDHEAMLRILLDTVPPALPEGAQWMGQLRLKDGSREGLELPLQLRLEPAR